MVIVIVDDAYNDHGRSLRRHCLHRIAINLVLIRGRGRKSRSAPARRRAQTRTDFVCTDIIVESPLVRVCH